MVSPKPAVEVFHKNGKLPVYNCTIKPIAMDSPLQFIGKKLARYLSKHREDRRQIATSSPETVLATLRKGDILLVEGTSRISEAIKYITQSTWSHSAFYIGDALGEDPSEEEARVLVEADVNEGVRAVPFDAYQHYHTRICRPVGLTESEIDQTVEYMTDRLGLSYDLKNIFDLARYLIQSPPVPQRHRRRLLALGSGDPTRAICSSLIAQAFQTIKYPILPEIDLEENDDPACRECYEEIHHIRHHSLFTPRDFDVSPYFRIVKPTLEHGFNHRRLQWSENGMHQSPASTG